MSNKLLFSSSAREKMTIGAKTLANARLLVYAFLLFI